MKQIIILLFLSLFIFSKCKKEKDEVKNNYFGYAKAQINGQPFEGKARGGFLYKNPDSLMLNFERWEGLILKEEIGFIKAAKSGRQKVYKQDYTQITQTKLTSLYGTFSDDGDVICDHYNVFEADSITNHLTITSYNEATKEVAGTFDVTYIIDAARQKCNPSAPDTIRIRKGEFKTKIF